MLLLLGLLGGANSTLLVSSINTLLTYLQVNTSLLFTSNGTMPCICFHFPKIWISQKGQKGTKYFNEGLSLSRQPNTSDKDRLSQ